jgi:hypothetical protein
MTIKGLVCPHCGSKDTEYYDGCLGYEAVRCNDCRIETDLHDPTNFCGRNDKQTERREAPIFI